MMIQRIHFETIDSTHAWGKKNSQAFDQNALTCITALEQTAGYGRRGRKWVSPHGLNLYMSLYFTLASPSENLAQLLTLSTVAILEKAGLEPQIKWPNDLLVNGKKIAGVLCETFASQGKTGALLSIGLNVNMPLEMLQEIDQPAISLAIATGSSWNLSALRDSLLKEFTQDFTLLRTRGFSPFINRYEKRLSHKGKSVRFFDGVKTLEGVCEGILPDGRLQLLLQSGEKMCMSSGDLYTQTTCL